MLPFHEPQFLQSNLIFQELLRCVLHVLDHQLTLTYYQEFLKEQEELLPHLQASLKYKVVVHF